MPKPATTQTKTVETAPVAETAVEKKARAPRVKKTEEAAPASAPASASASASASAPASASASAPAVAVVPDSSVEAVDDSTKTPRVPPTRESVLAEHAEIINLLEEEINRLRDGSDKSSGVKFLRTISRRVKSAQSNSARVMKQKVPSARKNNNSGFLKPVNISYDMAKFTGLDPSGLHSRVDVTKFLCKYIADHNLQNPTDKRTINADPALSKLLGYDAKKADQPLTYPRIQSLLKTHFTSQAQVPVVASASAPTSVAAKTK
jgi:chromatin remodeling complex protein RSC6